MSVATSTSGGAKKQYRAWCYTFYPDEALAASEMIHPPMDEIEFCRYAVAQLEKCPTKNRYHFQGYMECTSKKTLVAMKKIEGLKGAHWEPRGGTAEEAITYCTKEDSRVPADEGGSSYSYGTPSKGQGQRTDLEAAASDIRAGMSERDFAITHSVALVKYHRGFERLRSVLAKPVVTPTTIKPHAGWQADLVSALTAWPADKRTIHWVSDPKGKSGKSTIAQLLIRNHGAVFMGGKQADMAHAYNYERIVLFDVTRTAAEYSDHLYSFAEQLKNGVISSPKYESTAKMFFDQIPHVVFFANRLPDEGKWTEDRCKLYEVTVAPLFTPITIPKAHEGAGKKRLREE